MLTKYEQCILSTLNFQRSTRKIKKFEKMAVNTPLFTIAATVAAIGAFCRFESHRLPSTTDTDAHHNQSGAENKLIFKLFLPSNKNEITIA